MTKFLQKSDHHHDGMQWEEIQERYPHQWLLLEAIDAHSSEGKRILESLTVLETYPDGLSAMRGYSELHGQDPHRELYVLHTDRENLEIEEVRWTRILPASWLEENREAIKAYNENVAQHGVFSAGRRGF